MSQLARQSLPEDASEQDKESTVIDVYACELTKPEEVKAVFERYGKGAIWGVIHVAVRNILFKKYLSI